MRSPIQAALPSVSATLRKTRDTALRFPLSIVCAILATVAMFAVIDGVRGGAVRPLATAITGLAGITAVTITGERAGISRAYRRVAELVVAGGLMAWFGMSVRWPDAQATLRLFQMMVVAHLLVAVLPYWRSRSLHAFWQYNRALFIRFLAAALYTQVLWIGLAIALMGLHQLLGVPVSGKAYSYLWVALALLFHPWFVLAGIPKDYAALERIDDYPTDIKIFTQFVLIPLVTVYLAILTLYLARIIVIHSWPNGWIGYLVSSASAVGVLALLLVHPLREQPGAGWVNLYGRWFFTALLPSLAMLLLAIVKRVAEYGMTEPRYFLLALTLWLSALAVFYGITASRNIKLIPATLACIGAATIGGPWGAYQVSLRSQLHRLGAIAAANGMGRVGAFHAAPRSVSLNDRREISAIIDYLESRHGDDALARALGVPRDSVAGLAVDSVGRITTVAAGAARRLGVRYAETGDRIRGDRFVYTMKQPESYDVAGYDAMRPLFLFPRAVVQLDRDSLALVADSVLRGITVTIAGQAVLSLDLVAALRERGIPDSLSGQVAHLLDAPVTAEGEGGGLRVRLIVTEFNGTYGPGHTELGSVTGYILIHRR